MISRKTDLEQNFRGRILDLPGENSLEDLCSESLPGEELEQLRDKRSVSIDKTRASSDRLMIIARPD